ncbi:acyl transferase 15-like [Triticum dicoccoides]|uniref:acyl transferase 15-like n=1 Tax=Triticum dicoccoides TaxID=85692 RepID=UPI001890C5A0|nr:acyl transferase 15-like [Triticum dicoccoides]
MSVVVSKSSPVVVYPAEPRAPAGDVQLSPFDQRITPFAVTSILMFDHPIDKPIETVKLALSRALVYYRPVCGRLAGADHRIKCTDEGVPFVGASASCALDLEGITPALLADLAVAYAGPFCRRADALLQMQVTEFPCGGFVVGVTWNHVLADGTGMGQFLQAVGELARGMPRPSVIPVRSADAVRDIPPPTATAERRSLMKPKEKEGQGAFLDITVPSSLIGRVKAQCACTVFEAVAAVLWRCRTRAAVEHPDAPTPLIFPNNMRELFGAHDGYYGNCTIMKSVHATRAQVADGDIREVVRLVRRGKETLLEAEAEGGRAEAGGDLYNRLAVSSWRRIGLDAADFGGGTPARVMWHEDRMVVPECIVCPPWKGKDGVNVQSLCVKPEHAAAFLAELAAM